MRYNGIERWTRVAVLRRHRAYPEEILKYVDIEFISFVAVGSSLHELESG